MTVTREEIEEIEGLSEVTVEQIAKFMEVSRQTAARRVSILRSKPGPGGARYPKDPAFALVYCGTSEGSARQKLDRSDISVIDQQLLNHRLGELEDRLKPITSAHRLKKEVRTFLSELEEERRELNHALHARYNEQNHIDET